MELFRYANSVYGQSVLVGASWDLIWWCAGAGAALIIVHAVTKALLGGRASRSHGA